MVEWAISDGGADFSTAGLRRPGARSDFVPQPVMPLDLPVKVQPWKLTQLVRSLMPGSARGIDCNRTQSRDENDFTHLEERPATSWEGPKESRNEIALASHPTRLVEIDPGWHLARAFVPGLGPAPAIGPSSRALPGGSKHGCSQL